MNNCIKCNKETKNPRFCSRSCSVAYNNLSRVKNGILNKDKKCIVCGNKLKRTGKLFCSYNCTRKHQWEQLKQKWEKDGYFYPDTKYDTSARTVKKYLIEKYGEKCSICGQSSIWNNQPIVFILDHINGIANDWSISNFRLVCPNCDSQLPTYKRRNKNGGRAYRTNRTLV